MSKIFKKLTKYLVYKLDLDSNMSLICFITVKYSLSVILSILPFRVKIQALGVRMFDTPYKKGEQ